MPVKLIQHSPAMFVSAIGRLKGIFPRAPVVTIPDGNHFVQPDQAQGFARSLREAIAAKAAQRLVLPAMFRQKGGRFQVPVWVMDARPKMRADQRRDYTILTSLK